MMCSSVYRVVSLAVTHCTTAGSDGLPVVPPAHGRDGGHCRLQDQEGSRLGCSQCHSWWNR